MRSHRQEASFGGGSGDGRGEGGVEGNRIKDGTETCTLQGQAMEKGHVTWKYSISFLIFGGGDGVTVFHLYFVVDSLTVQPGWL